MKIYNSPDLDPDLSPRSLLNKVLFDVKYYLIRRANENMHGMKKDFLQLCFDSDYQITHLKKVKDEITKNHKESDTKIRSGFMSQILDADVRPHKLCPVRSFENYISHLNPKIDSMWQIPLNKIPMDPNEPWYKVEQLGHNTHEKFMGRLSDENKLSDHYTNHCIRVTGATNLMRSGFSSKQIMSIMGHKSIQSLTIYQKVKEDENTSMGISLMYNLIKPEEAKKIHDRMVQDKDKENDDQNELEPPPK